ncbi:Uncharacterised protein [Mycobacterium tuberculosis]|nr:Uncharacterised protein [Mycobacterium tuberculosis]
MVDGLSDLSDLYSRVTALEQADVDTDQTIARIVKLYGTLGIKVTYKTWLHQYRLCGDQNPLPTMSAVCASDAYI